MKRIFHLALLACALFGLAGQSAANAMSPHCEPMMERPVAAHSVPDMAMAAVMDCCPQSTPAKHDPKPGKEMMPNCLMMTGCAISLAVDNSPQFSSHFAMKPVAAIWPLATQLSGRSVPPEQRPPSIQS